MKKRILILSFTIVSIILLCFAGYIHLVPKAPHNAALTPVDNAKTIYANAASKIELSKDRVLTIHLTEEMTVDGATFQEVSSRTVYYDTQENGTPYIQMHETRHSGTHAIEILEAFANDTVYLTVNDTAFSGFCNMQQYQSTQIPEIIITPEHYNKIEAFDTEKSYIVRFSEANSPENWLSPYPVTLLNANGTAKISYEGDLVSSTYTASYQINNVTFRITATVSVEQKDIRVSLPEDTANYTQIKNWQAPKFLERACGYLLQAKQISSSYSDSIFFEAIGDLRESRITLHADFDKDWSVCVSTNITTSNEAKQDQSQTLDKKEIYLNGQYQISNNNDPLATNPSITVDEVYNYFQNQLVSTVMLPQHIRSCEIAESDNTLHIRFDGTDAFGSFLTQNACQLLYNNPNLINETDSNFTTNELTCYLDIDKITGLPLSSGINFVGRYKAEGLPYSLKYSADQSYRMPSPEAKAEIEKAAD